MAKLLGATRAFISVLYSLRLYAMQTTEKHFWSAAIFAWHHLISRSADQAPLRRRTGVRATRGEAKRKDQARTTASFGGTFNFVQHNDILVRDVLPAGMD